MPDNQIMETDIQAEFRTASLAQLQALRPQDIEIFEHKPVPPNYTVIARPDEETKRTIEKIIRELQQLEPNQFYYPLDQLHLTLIGNIPLSTNLDRLIETVQTELPKITLSFQLKGLGSNALCLSTSAYPQGFSLHTFRENIRHAVGAHGDDYSSFLASYEYVGWINFLRYYRAPSQLFLDRLYTYRDTVFGELKPSSVQIYRNMSQTIDPDNSQLLHEFVLS